MNACLSRADMVDHVRILLMDSHACVYKVIQEVSVKQV